MSIKTDKEPHVFHTIGPVAYVDTPDQVDAVFRAEPRTGTVIVKTSLWPEVLKEIPRIIKLAATSSSRAAFNRACGGTWLKAWFEEQIAELGPHYPTVDLFRGFDIPETPWHIDRMRGRRRAFLQIEGAGLRIAGPKSAMQLAFNTPGSEQPYCLAFCPAGVDPDEYLRQQGLKITHLRQGQMAVFGSFGLHASGLGQELRAIAY